MPDSRGGQGALERDMRAGARGLGAERRGGAAERAGRVDGGGDGGFATGVEPAKTIAKKKSLDFSNGR